MRLVSAWNFGVVCSERAARAPKGVRSHHVTGLIVAVGVFSLASASGPRAETVPLPPVRPKTLLVEPRTAPDLAQLNAYFNAIQGLEADFRQISPDGRAYRGVLHLLRPGRLRFDYAPPATLEVIADGRSVAIRDRRLDTMDTYFISQTPLKFLLAPRIDLARDMRVIDFRREGSLLALTLEDTNTFGGTSRIRLLFAEDPLGLLEWQVIDPQGLETQVILTNVNLEASPPLDLFVIPKILSNPN